MLIADSTLSQVTYCVLPFNPFAPKPSNPRQSTEPTKRTITLLQLRRNAMAPAIRLLMVAAAAAVLLCCVTQAAAAGKMPPQCLRAASALCQGESTDALACLKTKAMEGNIEIPMACATSLKVLDDAPAGPVAPLAAQGTSTRAAKLARMLSEGADCTNPSNGASCVTPFRCPNPASCCCRNGSWWDLPATPSCCPSV